MYGYYADVANDCQLFHVCYPVAYPDAQEEMPLGFASGAEGSEAGASVGAGSSLHAVARLHTSARCRDN